MEHRFVPRSFASLTSLATMATLATIGGVVGCGLATAGLPGHGTTSGTGGGGAPSTGTGTSHAAGTGGGSTSSGTGGSGTGGAGGSGGAGGGPITSASCAELHTAEPSAPSKVYPLTPKGGGAPYEAYCEMAADQGGWTLVLKIDGTKDTFEYSKSLWENEGVLAPDHPDLDDMTEAKLASFSTVPLTALRLGMFEAGMWRWLVVPVLGDSLLSLTKGGKYVQTAIAKQDWMGLVGSPSLQDHCNKQGINVFPGNYAHVRIGFVANEQHDCVTTDSLIGFGADQSHGGPSGNFACCSSNNGDKNTRTFGAVMVR